MNLTLKKFDENDIPQLINLSNSVGWDYCEAEIQTILCSGNIYGHINENNDIISSGAIITYDQKISSIGMVIVDNKYRSRGLGREVVDACIRLNVEPIPIMLISTKEGEFLYKKMGFKSISCVRKLLCDKYVPLNNCLVNNNYIVEPYQESDLLEVNQLDSKAFGANRIRFLKERIRQAVNRLVVRDKYNKIIGFGLSIETPINLILGPIIAINDEVANLLIYELSNKHQGLIRVDTLEEKREFCNNLKKQGFNEVASPPVMIFNDLELPSRNHQLYTIAAQVFG